MNPCPCGYLGDKEKTCICSPTQTQNYKKRISGPIIDRIDLHVEVPRIDFEKLSERTGGENSSTIKKRVEAARKIQRLRFQKTPFVTNSEMSSEAVKRFCALDNETKQIIKEAVEKLHLSARAYFRLLKLARTIADLASSESIKTSHMAEALQYRPKMD